MGGSTPIRCCLRPLQRFVKFHSATVQLQCCFLFCAIGSYQQFRIVQCGCTRAWCDSQAERCLRWDKSQNEPQAAWCQHWDPCAVAWMYELHLRSLHHLEINGLLVTFLQTRDRQGQGLQKFQITQLWYNADRLFFYCDEKSLWQIFKNESPGVLQGVWLIEAMLGTLVLQRVGGYTKR